MSHGRSGKLAAAVNQRQHNPHAKPHVPPLQFQKNGTQTSDAMVEAAPLWRDADAAIDSQRPAGTSRPLTGDAAGSFTAGASDPRKWTWDVILAASQQHGTTSRPYGGGGPSVASSFEPANSREGLDLGRAYSPVAAAEARARSRPPRMLPPQSTAIGLMVDGEMMGAAAAANDGTGYMQQTHTRTHETTTTTVTHTQTRVSESLTTTAVAPKPRAVGDSGAMLSYGSDDGPSAYTSALLPALRTSEREELRQLSAALDFFVSELDTKRMGAVRLDERDAVDSLLDLLKEEQGVYDLFFDEAIRQVSTQCRERGELLAKIRAFYAALLQRVPLHLYSLQSELAAQRQLNHTLQEEHRVLRESQFAVEVELGAYTHRFKEAAHELAMEKELLSRAEHEKDRARAMFTQFKEEWDTQRRALEEQLAIMKEEREDYLATAAATAAALQKSRQPNAIVTSLLDDSDSDEERKQARRALLKTMLPADAHVDDMIDATERQAALHPAYETRITSADAAVPDEAAQADASLSSEATAVITVELTPAEVRENAVLAERRARHEAMRREDAIRREKDRAEAAAAAAAIAAAGLHVEESATLSSDGSLPLLVPTHSHTLSSLPDFGAAEGGEAVAPPPPRRFQRRTSAIGLASEAAAIAAKQQKKEVRQLRRTFNSEAMREARETEAETLEKWTAADPATRDAMCAQLRDHLPQLPASALEAAIAASSAPSSASSSISCVPLVLDFLSRIDSCSFNQSELMLLRTHLPPRVNDNATPPWTEALRTELARRGLREVADDLFSDANERAAQIAHLMADQDDDATSSDEEGRKSRRKTAESSQALQQQADQDYDTLGKLASPLATRSARHGAEKVAPEVGVSDATVTKAVRLQKKLAREERRRRRDADKAAGAGTGEDDSASDASVGQRSRTTTAAADTATTKRRTKPAHSRQGSTASISKVSLSPRREQANKSSKGPSTRRRSAQRRADTGGSTASSVSPTAASLSRGNSFARISKHEVDSPRGVGAGAARSTRAPLSRDSERHSVAQVQRGGGGAAAASAASGARVHTASVLHAGGAGSDDDLAVELVGGVGGAASASDSDDAHKDRRRRPARDSDSSTTDSSDSGADEQTTSATRTGQGRDLLSSRRSTLPADGLQQSSSSGLLAARAADLVRPKSITVGAAEPAPGKHRPPVKAHHRHHSRADPSTFATGASSAAAAAAGTSGSHAAAASIAIPAAAHPILTLRAEHALAANDPRANDDDEIVYRPNNTQPKDAQPAATTTTTTTAPSSNAPPLIPSKPTVPRRTVAASDSSAPLSFFEASQVVPVSKIVVTATTRPSAGVVETPRERELQLVVSDLIAQNELLHAQRQALAHLHGVRDTGAPALPEVLGNFETGSQEAAAFVQAASRSNAPQSATAKQNALLGKVNEYLAAYRAAKKAASVSEGAHPTATLPTTATPDGTNPHQPFTHAAPTDPAAVASSLARNVVAGGARDLLYNSRFLSLLKASPAGGRVVDHGEADEHTETKEQDGHISSRATSRSRVSSLSSHVGGGGSTSFSVPWLVKWLRGVYDQKLARDDLCRKESVPLQPFPEFLLEVQRKQYGLESICARKTWTIVRSLAAHRDADREIGLFADFLEESRTLDELILFLRTRAVVMASTVGVRWAGHLLERAGTKSCAEYISLCRARDVIATIFASAPDMQDAAYRAVLACAVTWNQIPDPISAARWDAMLPGRNAQIDERCIRMTDFLERMIDQFRAIELQLRHQQWAEELFNSAVGPAAHNGELTVDGQLQVGVGGDVRMDFASFQQVFSLAEPRYSPREIAHLYSNVTRHAGLKTLSRSLFKRLIHQLMNEGVMFPLLKHAGYAAATLVRMVIRHWHSFQPFFDHLHRQLSHSEHATDVAAANHLRQIRFALEKEIARASSGAAALEEDVDGGPTGVVAVTRRLVSIYRGMLNVISSHQAAFMSAKVDTPMQVLHTELKAMQHIILQRHRLRDTNESRVDSWLESVSLLEADDRNSDDLHDRRSLRGSFPGDAADSGSALGRYSTPASEAASDLHAADLTHSRNTSARQQPHAHAYPHSQSQASTWTTPDHEVMRHFQRAQQQGR